jgi:peptide deformylase
MGVLNVTKLGNPVLRKAAEAVPRETLGTAKFKRLLADMVDTMHTCEGVGIAAPQVDVSWRLAVIEVKADARSERPIPLTVLINPKITASSKTMLTDWEGCLSINDLRGQVPRAEWVEVEMLNQKGERVSFRAEGFFARVVQHECDHLIGHLFIDRMPHLKTLCHLREFVQFVRE